MFIEIDRTEIKNDHCSLILVLLIGEVAINSRTIKQWDKAAGTGRLRGR